MINKSIAPRNVWEADESWTLIDQAHLHVQQERMPLGRGVISNCVINLSVDKPAVLTPGLDEAVSRRAVS